MLRRDDITQARRTKIVATLGPASSTPDVIRRLLEAGMDVARINASHGDHASLAKLIAEVRRQARELGRTIAILFDLQGPKIRIGTLEAPRAIQRGQEVTIAVGRPTKGDELPTDHGLLDKDVLPGHPLLIDDGQLAMEVVSVEPGSVRCRALNDGTISSRKGINLPESHVSIPAITEKDKADALFAVEQNVDAIALSFVRRKEDVVELRALLSRAGAQTPVVSKIEKPQALTNLRGILKVSWGVMVARGDLGVELPPEQVPMAQKRIIREAIRYGRPVITATQMLDSMTRNPRPTRAETSDVANAVLDGTDAVMLSGETAAGRYPVESVQMMVRIIGATESSQPERQIQRRKKREIDTISRAVIDAGCGVAHHLEAKAIVAFTESGRTALLTAQRRPDRQIIAFTPVPAVQQLLSFVWGVQPYHLAATDTVDHLVELLDRGLLEGGRVNRGDPLVLLMGLPMGRAGRTNVMMVHRVGSLDSSFSA
jgi:pyruvate kinase